MVTLADSYTRGNNKIIQDFAGSVSPTPGVPDAQQSPRPSPSVSSSSVPPTPGPTPGQGFGSENKKQDTVPLQTNPWQPGKEDANPEITAQFFSDLSSYFEPPTDDKGMPIESSITVAGDSLKAGLQRVLFGRPQVEDESRDLSTKYKMGRDPSGKKVALPTLEIQGNLKKANKFVENFQGSKPIGGSVKDRATKKFNEAILWGGIDNELVEPKIFDKLFSKYEDVQADAIKDRRQNIQNMLQMGQAVSEAGPAQVDLRPLAHLVDVQTGSNFATYYKAPRGGEERLQMAQALMKGIENEKQAISKERQAGIKLKLDTTLKRQNLEANNRIKEMNAAINIAKLYGIEEGKGLQDALSLKSPSAYARKSYEFFSYLESAAKTMKDLLTKKKVDLSSLPDAIVRKFGLFRSTDEEKWAQASSMFTQLFSRSLTGAAQKDEELGQARLLTIPQVSLREAREKAHIYIDTQERIVQSKLESAQPMPQYLEQLAEIKARQSGGIRPPITKTEAAPKPKPIPGVRSNIVNGWSGFSNEKKKSLRKSLSAAERQAILGR